MKWVKGGFVVFGAVVITTLGIDAADTLQGEQGTLLAQLAGVEYSVCPAGMIKVPAATTFQCVDQFEASPSLSCPHQVTHTMTESRNNTASPSCEPVTEVGAMPWRFVTRDEAQMLCLRAGKRLPTNAEWQMLALGTPDSEEMCNTHSNAIRETGMYSECTSALGILDTVGNVWEWTADDVIDGRYEDRVLPQEGYVTQAAADGVAVETATSSSQEHGDDYFFSESEGTFAFMRGGFYGSRSDAGIYAAHAATLPTLRGAAIGFRCVQ